MRRVPSRSPNIQTPAATEKIGSTKYPTDASTALPSWIAQMNSHQFCATKNVASRIVPGRSRSVATMRPARPVATQ